MSDDLVKRLRSGPINLELAEEAATRISSLEEANGTMAMMSYGDGKRITALEAENKRLREVLEPFAMKAESFAVASDDYFILKGLSVGGFRRAAAAMEKK